MPNTSQTISLKAGQNLVLILSVEWAGLRPYLLERETYWVGLIGERCSLAMEVRAFCCCVGSMEAPGDVGRAGRERNERRN